MIKQFIYGIPVPQGRPRARVFRNGPRPLVSMYDPKPSKDWKKDVAKQAKAARQELMEGPLSMELVFYMPRPKSLPKKVQHHTKKPDVDNLAKAISDALNGIFYRDDSQIVSMRLRKQYCEENPGVLVVIEPFELPF